MSTHTPQRRANRTSRDTVRDTPKPKRTPARRRAPRSRQRRRALIAAATLLALLTGTALLTTPNTTPVLGPLAQAVRHLPGATPLANTLSHTLGLGNINPDPNNPEGYTNVPDPATAKAATTTRTTFTTTTAPTKGVVAALTTPTGEQWWQLVTSLAGSLNTITVPTPKGAIWYGYTNARSYASNAPNLVNYDAIYVAFKTPDDAMAFNKSLLKSEGTDQRYVLIRGNIVTVGPTWLALEKEPFNHTIKNTPTLTTPPKAASWYIDFAAQADLAATKSPYRDAYLTYFHNLGFTNPHTPWQGTSTNPEGPWVGHVTGWNANNLNADTAIRTLAATATGPCTKPTTGTNTASTSCTITNLGLIELGSYTAIQTKTLGWGASQYAPTLRPPGTALAYGYNNRNTTGIIDGTHNAGATHLTRVAYTITTDGTLTLQTPLGNEAPITAENHTPPQPLNTPSK